MAAESRNPQTDRDPTVRWMRAFTEVRRSELRALLLFFATAFLMLASYYVIRALREGFILVDFGATARSLAVGVVTVILIFFVPAYAKVRERVGSNRLVLWVFAFFAVTLLAFYFAWRAELRIGFVFFVWVGLFGLLVISQFWAVANGSWEEASGKRLFPFIMLGANVGALAGTEVASFATEHGGLDGLMLAGLALLIASMVLLPVAARAVPSRRTPPEASSGRQGSFLGGFTVIAADRYLVLMAIAVVLLNWINSTGEYLFARFVEMHSVTQLPATATAEMQAEYVTGVYADFMLWYTGLGVVMQTFVVSRLFRWIGIGRSALVLPTLVTVSYLLIAFVPVFSIIRWVKVAENATDYSLMGTVRHALFLPTSEDAKYDAKTAIDTFFWRLGDLFQAGMVWAGVSWLGWDVRTFAIAAAVLSLLFLACTAALAREYRRRVPDDGLRLEGRVAIHPGEAVDVRIPQVVETMPPAGLANIAAYVDDGTPLPAWLAFDAAEKRLEGVTPEDFAGILRLRIEGRDDDGSDRRFPVSLVSVRHG